MGTFSGSLRANEIFASLYNMIISQEVFADNISHNFNLVDEARVDGGLYGDTKLYYATDVLRSKVWGADAEAANLLSLDRPPAPSCQSIILNKFRQIRLTIDNYLTKRAWLNEGAFGMFTSVMLGWMNETRRVYENTLYNVFIGNAESATGGQTVSLSYTLPSGVVKGTEEANRLTGAYIAKNIADLMIKVKDYSRDFNDYGYMRSYDEAEMKFIWNADYLNEILLIDLPTIFHSEELKKHLFDRVLPARYFGQGITTTTANNTALGTSIRFADEYHGDASNAPAAAQGKTFFAGDAGVASLDSGDLEEPYSSGIKYYTPATDIVCKIFVKLPPFMSAFVVGTSFFNPRSLTENRYLTFGFNDLEYLKNYPVITIKLSVSEAAADGDGGAE